MNSIDLLCDEFEARRKQGERPELAEWLRRASVDERGQLLRELIAIDVYYRRQAGEQPNEQEYLQQFPDLDAAAISAELKRPAVDQPTIDISASAATGLYVRADAEGTALGPYTLERLLGEGGMGSVWVAKQRHPVKRRVALKLIKTGMDSREVVRRFEQERQALAVMDHPNIARVLDAGLTPDGRPYFAMELVNGLPLTAFCDEAKLKTKDRLDIFVQICAAVQHAHQKGVIHRDLKPGNILVTLIDGRPVPKVIDFGVAKALAGKLTEETLSTHFGAVIGTLEYMAPEQAGFSGTDIDTRADIYALGVILYELLTGLRPFDSSRFRQAALHEIIRIIQEEEPSKPSNRVSTSDSLPSLAAARQIDPRLLSRSLRGDLDWIALKCLEKDRGRRYETANQLALEIQRHLADEPVLAGPPSAGYRLKKFVRRNRLSVVAGSAVLLALVMGLIGSLWQMNRAIIAERKAVDSKEEESKQRKLAVENGKEAKHNAEESQRYAEEAKRQAQQAEEGNRRARAALDTIIDDVVQTLIAKQEKLGEKEQQFLRKVLEQYGTFAQSAGGTAEALRLKANAHWQIALLQVRLGADADAAAAFQEMRSTYEMLVKLDPGNIDARAQVAGAYRMAAWQLLSCGQPGEAARLLEESNQQLRSLLIESPRHGEVLQWLGIVEMDRGSAFERSGQMEEAKQAYEESIGLFTQLAAIYPERYYASRLMADAEARLTGWLIRTGAKQEALARSGHAVELLVKLQQEHPEELLAHHHASIFLTVRQNRGALLLEAGQAEEAAQSYREGATLAESFIKAYPAEPNNHVARITCHLGLARCLQVLGNSPEQLVALQAAEASATRLVANYPDVVDHLKWLSEAQAEIAWNQIRRNGQLGAVTALERAIATHQSLIEKSPQAADARERLASLYQWLGQASAELANLPRSLEAYQGELTLREAMAAEAPGKPQFKAEVAKTHESLSFIYLRLDQFSAAATERAAASEVLGQLLTEDPDQLIWRDRLWHLHHLTADRLSNKGKTAAALEQYQIAWELADTLLKRVPDDENYRRQAAWSHHHGGNILLQQDKVDEAMAHYRTSLQSWGESVRVDPSHRKFRDDCANEIDQYAEYKLRATGRPAAALSAFRYTLTIREKLIADYPLEGSHHLHMGWSRFNIGMALLDLKQPEEAQVEFRQITALMKRHAAALPADAQHQKLLADLHDKVAEILRARGQLSSSDELFRAALAAREQLARDYPDDGYYGWQIAWSHYHLATIHLARGDKDAAAAEYEQTFAGVEKRLREIPDDVKFVGEFDDMVLRMCEQLDTVSSWETMASFAERYRDIVAEIRPKSLLPRATIFSLGGVSLLRQKKYLAAEGMYRKCLELREIQEPNSWVTFNTQSILGEVLLEQQKYEEAAPLLQSAYEGMAARSVTIPSSVIHRLHNAVERLIRLAKETNKPEELLKWQQELDRQRGLKSTAPLTDPGEKRKSPKE